MKDRQPILHLNLHRKWFDMIESGEKTEEYRLTETWGKRFECRLTRGEYKTAEEWINIKGEFYRPEDVLICFSNGYRKDRRQLFCKIESLTTTNHCREEWGAEPNTWYYVFSIKKIDKPAINNETP